MHFIFYRRAIPLNSTCIVRKNIKMPNAADCPGYRFRIKDALGNTAVANITVSPMTGQTIDGAASKTLTSNYQLIVLRSLGDNWITET